MGASGWHYFVAYDADVSRALEKLREEVFRRGEYFAPGKAKPATLDELLELCAEDGTHSILDVTRVSSAPLPPGINAWLASFTAENGRGPTPDEIRVYTMEGIAAIGAVGPISEAAVVAACGVAKPDHSALEKSLIALFDQCPRGAGVWTTVFDAAGAPSELLFAGKTGD